MSDFKVGDEVWFFHHHRTNSFWGDDTNAVYPGSLQICNGTIIAINQRQDYVHVYIDGDRELASFGEVYCEEYLFKTKQMAINEFIKKLEKLAQND